MSTPSVGKGFVRKDGRAKVTGAAAYSGDVIEPKALHAVIFTSSIPCGEVDKYDIAAAQRVPGVVQILTSENAPKIKKSASKSPTAFGDPHMPLQDNKINYNGQPIGIVVAASLEAAEQAARLVKIHYKADKAKLDFDAQRKTSASKTLKKDGMGRPVTVTKGSVDKELKKAAIQMKATYTIPIENHHPMEPHATLADWQGDKLTVYEATQGVANAAKNLAELFGLKPENVHVITKFVGGGFGSKGSLWTHALMAILASKATQRPVKIAIERSQMGTNIGYRARTVQDVVLGSDEKGKLLAIQHETNNPTAIYKEYPETTGALFQLLYAAPAISTTQKVVHLNYPGPTFMRAPGESSGSFAIESAMDELAYKVGVDPIQLRLLNYAEKDPIKDIPFSSKSLKECYERGAKEFGWERRNSKPGSTRDGDWYHGVGMATSSYPVHFFPASARAELLKDGTAKVTSATQDIGTGTYTVMTQIAADCLGLPYEKVSFDLGDSKYPAAGVSGGSSTVSSVGWAIADASNNLLTALKAIAVADKESPLFQQNPADIVAVESRLQLIKDPKRGDSYQALLKRHNTDSVAAEGKMDDKKQKENEKKYSQHSFGAQFAEVRVHAITGEVRLVKMVGAFAAGKIVNPKTARSQFMGGMIFGIGMGLTEINVVDERYGKFMNNDLAEYHVPVNLDVPDLNIIMVEETDTIVNPAGTKGIGEIGTVGTAAAIANAVFNATGIRVRDIPITPDKLAAEFFKRG